MKYKVRLSDKHEVLEAEYGLIVFDGKGIGYMIQLNSDGELEII